MKIKITTFMLLICIVAGCGCTDNGSAGDEQNTTATPDAVALYNSFTENDSYTEWNIWPGTEAFMKGNGVHGDYVSIYVSDNALSAAREKASAMPYETIVLKRGFNADKELTGIYVMYKSEGYDPENNDWFWASYSADGTVRSEGKVEGCIGCHRQKSSADYIFVNA